MSGLYYTNPATNPYLSSLQNFDSQYGVNMPQVGMSGQDSSIFSGLSGLSQIVPFIGPLLGAAFNAMSTSAQNQNQVNFFEGYMSPKARMRQMAEAGINPAAAAQGISQAPAPQMTAATPSSAYTGIGEQLGNSANNALTASLLKSQINKTDAEANLTKSLDVEQVIKNAYADREHAAALDKLVADGEISRSTANMLKVDEYYKGATALANYEQLLMNLSKTDAEIRQLEASIVHEYAAAYQAMASGALSEAQIHKVFSDIGLNNAQIEKISHEVQNIDAQTASTYQDIDESKARQALTEIQTKFQEDYYGIWETTGFNWNSDVEKSIVGAVSNMQVDEAERMLKGVGLYITNAGDATAKSKSYKTDKAFQLFGDITRFAGLVGIGSSPNSAISRVPIFRRKQQ